MQRQVTSETTENFSIATAIQNHSNNFSNKLKNKYCEHCNKEGHTIENCRTLKFHCKHCDRKGHTEDICRYKNSSWKPNITSNRQGQLQHGFRKNPFPATNVTNSSQSTHEVYPHDTSNTSQVSNPNNVLHGFSTDNFNCFLVLYQ
ncbi:hypothetical protein ACOSQ3_014879 [Xanthoceras sorbifolium]